VFRAPEGAREECRTGVLGATRAPQSERFGTVDVKAVFTTAVSISHDSLE